VAPVLLGEAMPSPARFPPRKTTGFEQMYRRILTILILRVLP
jgi:hypothetical protein